MDLEKSIMDGFLKAQEDIKNAFPLPFEEVKNEIMKAKRAQVGEVREWGGVKMQKTANGWVPVKVGGKGKTPEDKPGEKKPGSPEEGKLDAPNDISEHAKKASEAALQNAIKNSPDPEVRAAAHKELQRRTTEEKSEMFKKPEEPKEEPGSQEDMDKIESDKAEAKKEELRSEPKKEEQGWDEGDNVAFTFDGVNRSGKISKVVSTDNGFRYRIKDNKGNEFSVGSKDIANSPTRYNESDKKEEPVKGDKKTPKLGYSANSLSGNTKEVYNKLQDSIHDWFAASVEKGGDTDVPEGKGVDQILDLLDEIQTPMGGLGEGIGEALSYVDPYDEAGLKAALKSIERKLKKYSGNIEDIKLPSKKDDIKKSLHSTYQFLEGQSNLLQKSHINEFILSDSFSVSKTGIELKQKFEEQLKLELDEIRENSRKASELLSEINEVPDCSFEDEYYWAVDGYEDKIQQLPMVFKSSGKIVDSPGLDDNKWEYNNFARKIVDGMIEVLHLNTLMNTIVDGKQYKLTVKQASILGY